MKPDCSIKRENVSDTDYSGVCKVVGLKIKMAIKEDMASDNNY